MGAVTVDELLAEARDHALEGDVNAAIDSIAEAVQVTFDVAQSAAVRAGVPQNPSGS